MTRKNDLISSGLILADLEGIIGVRSMQPIVEVVQLAYKEIEFITTKLRNAGCKKISVGNIHNMGTDLERSILENMGIDLIQGVEELISTIQNFDFAIMIGFHGKKNSGGRFDHTFRMDFQSVYYNEQSMGEVGLFVRWLYSEGVPVILISGEGNFHDEVSEFEIPVVSSTSSSMQEYCNALDAALRQKSYSIHYIPDEAVIVKVDNPDKYCILEDFPYCDQEKCCFCFPSIKCLFQNIYNLAYRLNQATELIFRENVEFIKWVGKHRKEKRDVECLLHDFLYKDILLLSHFDRAEIAKRVGLKYESFLINHKKML